MGPPIPDGLDATLVLVRHGESTFIAQQRFQGQAETPLSPRGRRQADLIAHRLARPHDPPTLPVPGGPLLELVHSPLGRATQTAGAIAAALATEAGPFTVRSDPAFLEISQGAWDGLHRTEVEARYARELSAWRQRPLQAWAPGGESIPEVQARVRLGLAVLLARLADGRAPGSPGQSQVAGYREPVPDHPWSIVVGHDGVFKVLLLTLFDLPLERFWMWSMDLCGLSVIELRAGRPVLRAHNLTAHLAGLLDEAPADDDQRRRGGAL